MKQRQRRGHEGQGELMNASSESGFASAPLIYVILHPVCCRFMFCEQDSFSQVLTERGSE